MRIGTGFDVHRLVENRKLIMGGVDIPHHKGLEGHSDADVLTHAVMDALLGAAGLGDIGGLFPDSDPAFKGISSLKLLQQVVDLIEEKQMAIDYVDTVIIAQRPKMRAYIHDMKQNLADTMHIASARMNIKATTTEQLGFVGREEGIAAQAVVLLQERSSSTY